MFKTTLYKYLNFLIVFSANSSHPNDKTVNLISEWMIFAIESSKDKDKIEKYL